MAAAWGEGRTQLTAADVIERPSGLAVAILLGDGSATYPYMVRIATETGGAIVAESQAELAAKRAMVRDLEGIDICYSAATAVAAVSLEAAQGRISEDELVLVNLTGRHR
jgi:threonine synthase